MSMDWIIRNYQDAELEKKAINETMELCAKQISNQQVVDDALQSFRNKSIDGSNSNEKEAKNILINIAKTKRMTYEQKKQLILFLVDRFEEGYRVDYSYIFDKKVA